MVWYRTSLRWWGDHARTMRLERRDFVKAVGGLAGASIFGVAEASGETQTPGGDGSAGRDEPFFLENDDLLDNEELERLMRMIEQDGKDVSITKLGESTQGRPIWDISVGRGSTNVMAIAQQHGDELIMPEGTLAAVEFLATCEEPAVKQVRNELTLHLVPRVNPDGFVARQRYNVDTDAPQEAGADIFGADIGIFAAETPFVGWDINRYHWDDWTNSDLYQSYPEKFPENPVKEADVLETAVTQSIDPDWIIDYHRQGEYVVDENRTYDPAYPDEQIEDDEPYPPESDDAGAGHIVTSSIFWPINDGVREEVKDYSKQLAYLMYDELTTDSKANVTWYPGGTYAGIARNQHGLQGRGSVLFELSAGTLGSREYRVQHVAESLLAVTKATATGSLSDVDPSNVTQIPGRGDDVTAEGEADRKPE